MQNAVVAHVHGVIADYVLGIIVRDRFQIPKFSFGVLLVEHISYLYIEFVTAF